MNNTAILDWVKAEFQPVSLATVDETILQIIANAKRYYNTHSSFPVCKMFPATVGTISLPITPDYKNVVQVYPATTPDWVLQNYPLWSLLGITIIDNLTSDLIMLSEAFRNYRYYMGTDFKFWFEKSDDPSIGGTLFLSNLPGPTSTIAVVGTKRIVDGVVQQLLISGTSGTLPFYPLEEGSVVLTNGQQTYTDDGNGNLISSLSLYSGTVNYTTGAWTVTNWAVGPMIGTASYIYYEDLKTENILYWLLYYVKALVKMAEGNTLRKADAIDIKNDGQRLYEEGTTEKKDLEEKLAVEGRWLTFVRRT